MRMVEQHLNSGALYLVEGAPAASRPAYVVYTADPKDATVMRNAVELLHEIARETA